MRQSPTRGYGLLEPYLARQRAGIANRLIPDHLREGRILDIGCGSDPYFLAHTSFREKFAINKISDRSAGDGIVWHTLDLEATPELPFEEGFFSVVTMLAVIEHLDPTNLVELFREGHRMLARGGYLILTTPAAWSDLILRIMSRLKLVSKDEIDEHVFAYTLPLLGWYFGAAGFEMRSVRFGYFEMGLNLWATAQR